MKKKSGILYFGGCFAVAGAISASTILILASQGYIDIQPKQENTNSSANSRIVSDSDNTSSVELAKLKKAIEDKEKAIQEKDKTIQEKEKAIQEKDKTIKDKEGVIKTKDTTIKDKEKTIKSKNETIKALTPQIEFDKTPKRMNLPNVDWTGAFVYKDGLDNSFQYVVTKSGVFEYDTKRPDEFNRLTDWNGIGDPTGGFMFQMTSVNLETIKFLGTKNGLWVQNMSGGQVEQVAKGDYSNVNMFATDNPNGSEAFIYDKTGELKKVTQDKATKKWSIESKPTLTGLPKNPKGVKTIRNVSNDKSIMYIYGDEGITAVSYGTKVQMEKLTSKPVKNIDVLTNAADIENVAHSDSIFTLGIIFDDSVALMKVLPNNKGDWKKFIKPIKEIPVKDDLTDAKLMFIKDEGKMVPALITKAGLKIFVGTRFFDLMRADGNKETEDFTKSLVFDASSFTAIANSKGLRTIKIIHPKVKAYTSPSVNIYQKK